MVANEAFPGNCIIGFRIDKKKQNQYTYAPGMRNIETATPNASGA